MISPAIEKRAAVMRRKFACAKIFHGRLQTDYIDLYQVQGWDSNTPLEETLRTLDDIVLQGKVRYIGLSNFMSWQAATAVNQRGGQAL